MSKKNSKKNKSKSKDRFRNSIITSESVIDNSPINVKQEVSIVPNTVNSTSPTRINSLATELKLIGLIGTTLATILVITSFII